MPKDEEEKIEETTKQIADMNMKPDINDVYRSSKPGVYELHGFITH